MCKNHKISTFLTKTVACFAFASILLQHETIAKQIIVDDYVSDYDGDMSGEEGFDLVDGKRELWDKK